ncbi:hypothetical protein ACIBSS_34110 [Micromonospora aurantiaca]|uniref:hypothetical protein n=1 Tax=Micromonospora aurantiaca (nom. illeg.) TaxID=47850 RepID=UPI0037A84EA9
MASQPIDGRITVVVSSIRQKVIKWAFFGVAVALTPLFANFLIAQSRATAISYDTLVGRGELLLVAAGMGAAGIGELFGTEVNRMPSIRMVLGGCNILLVSLASLWFADIASAHQAKEFVEVGVVAEGSTFLFLCTLGVTACCIVVSELR